MHSGNSLQASQDNAHVPHVLFLTDHCSEDVIWCVILRILSVYSYVLFCDTFFGAEVSSHPVASFRWQQSGLHGVLLNRSGTSSVSGHLLRMWSEMSCNDGLRLWLHFTRNRSSKLHNFTWCSLLPRVHMCAKVSSIHFISNLNISLTTMLIMVGFLFCLRLLYSGKTVRSQPIESGSESPIH